MKNFKALVLTALTVLAIGAPGMANPRMGNSFCNDLAGNLHGVDAGLFGDALGSSCSGSQIQSAQTQQQIYNAECRKAGYNGAKGTQGNNIICY